MKQSALNNIHYLDAPSTRALDDPPDGIEGDHRHAAAEVRAKNLQTEFHQAVDDSQKAANEGSYLEVLERAAKTALKLAIENEFPGKIALVSSFGAEAVVLLHLVSRVAPQTPVIFLDTGKHFAQTLSYRKTVASRFGLSDVRDIPPAPEDLAANDPSGDLWRRDADACCQIRKVRPLKNALDGFDAWITGRKQFHGGARLSLPVFEASNAQIKVNPLVAWRPEDINAYMEKYDLPVHPLVAQGFPSIGCWPCTKPASPDEDVRAGRWRGADKTECGIHRI